MSFDLGAMLADVSKSDTREQIEYIPLENLESDPNNFYQLSGVEDLASNIALCGVQQPIRVRPGQGGHYIIVSGHRRRAALESLAKEDPQRWKEVPCIVERDSVSPALQQLRLIYANANTRTMTSAEVSQQAEQVEKLLYKLQEEGFDFPGRMRDHVAQAVQVSTSKLARLKVIRENLAEEWRPAFQDDKLKESTAYELAKMPLEWQRIFWEANKKAIRYLYADSVKRKAAALNKLTEMECSKGHSQCVKGISANDHLPFHYGFTDTNAEALCAVADLLHCSVDYLLGRSSDPEQATPWNTGKPWNVGEYVVMVRYSPECSACVSTVHWDGTSWWEDGTPLEEMGAEILLWTEMPEVE